MDPFNLEERYKSYLYKVKIKEEDMSPVQKVETKRAFMAGCAEVLVLMTDDIADMEEDDAVLKIDSLVDQVQEFWDKQTNEY